MRVLVTRPEPGASETAARLEALGHEAVVLPLTEIRGLKVTDIPDPGAVEAVAVTSSNAVRHAPDELLSPILERPCFAVGERTAEVCRKAGFRQVTNARGDAAALASLLVARLDTGARIAYLCGRVRRLDFEAMLAEAGVSVRPIETYDTIRIEPSAKAVQHLLAGEPVDAVMIHSRAGAEALAGLARHPDIARLLDQAMYFCISARVAKSLGLPPAQRLAIAPEPTETALISFVAAAERQNPFPDTPV